MNSWDRFSDGSDSAPDGGRELHVYLRDTKDTRVGGAARPRPFMCATGAAIWAAAHTLRKADMDVNVRPRRFHIA